MSQESVEVVERAVDAFNRRDVGGMLDLVACDYEWLPAMPVTLGGGAFQGREGIESNLREVDGAWAEQRVV